VPLPHRHVIRVYYEDTDFSGSVYHASYLCFLERGRTELLRSLDIHQAALHAGKEGPAFGFVVRAMKIDFLKPALMDDVIAVDTDVIRVGGASAELGQRILRGGEVLVAAEVRVAAVANGRAFRLPADIRKKLGAGVSRG
jgi:acyl-CoA thioester hydrolase